MCYQTQQTKTVKDLELQYNVIIAEERLRTLFDPPNYHINGFAHPNMLVIPMAKTNVLAPGVWGIVPFDKQPEEIKEYYKEAVRYGGGLNAQSEKLFKHYLYRNVVYTQRCIIPVTGFFEPHTFKNKSYPYYIHRKDKEALSLAGIYSVIGTYITFSILTKAASPLFEKIHNKRKRQPVILENDKVTTWLDDGLEETDIKKLIEDQYPDDQLESYTITKDFYKSAIDTNKPYVTEKVEYPELTAKLL